MEIIRSYSSIPTGTWTTLSIPSKIVFTKSGANYLGRDVLVYAPIERVQFKMSARVSFDHFRFMSNKLPIIVTLENQWKFYRHVDINGGSFSGGSIFMSLFVGLNSYLLCWFIGLFFLKSVTLGENIPRKLLLVWIIFCVFLRLMREQSEFLNCTNNTFFVAMERNQNLNIPYFGNEQTITISTIYFSLV